MPIKKTKQVDPEHYSVGKLGSHDNFFALMLREVRENACRLSTFCFTWKSQILKIDADFLIV